MPVDMPATVPYISGRFDSFKLPSDFELGNMKQYGSFTNRRLDPDIVYKVFLRAYTVDPVRIHTISELALCDWCA
jgi:hypothetical protein